MSTPIFSRRELGYLKLWRLIHQGLKELGGKAVWAPQGPDCIHSFAETTPEGNLRTSIILGIDEVRLTPTLELEEHHTNVFGGRWKKWTNPKYGLAYDPLRITRDLRQVHRFVEVTLAKAGLRDEPPYWNGESLAEYC